MTLPLPQRPATSMVSWRTRFWIRLTQSGRKTDGGRRPRRQRVGAAGKEGVSVDAATVDALLYVVVNVGLGAAAGLALVWLVNRLLDR